METVNSVALVSDRCASAFARMFWAFPFFLDFHLGINHIKIDLLPDLIGWLIFAWALNSILDLAPIVLVLRNFSYVLAVFSLFDLVEHPGLEIQSMLNFGDWLSPIALFRLAYLILDLVFIIKLCGLVIEMAAALEQGKILERAEFCRAAYLVLFLMPVPAMLLVLFAPFLAFPIFILLTGFSLVVLLLLMGLMKQVEGMCNWAVYS